MRCVEKVYAFSVIAAAVLCGGESAFADPALDDLAVTPRSESHLNGGARPEKFLYFSGFDLWRSGGSFYGGLQWAPKGLNEDGFTLKLLLAEGSYRYLAGSANVRGVGLLASIMPGWRIKRGNFEIKVFAGLDLQNHRLYPDDPGNSLRGNHAGLRVGADLWWEPTSRMMFASSISGSTIGTTFGVRGAAGWRVMDRFWTGPEIETSGDEVYRQYRIGAHLTSFKTAVFEWSLGAGYVQDNSHRSGLYGRIGLLTRQ
ncbi:MAG: cellulose biosynthesis protein BcsS [Afipia sp.]|nr:cellulose biosynthesis protein BcsS [Afipia sp.]